MSQFYTSRVVLLLLLLCTFRSVVESQAPADIVLSLRIDQEVDRWMREGKIPGLSLVLIDSGKVQIYCYGYANREGKKPVTPATLFQIGSCSKAFTALGVQRLFEEGVLQPEKYVSDYISGFRVFFKDSAVRITLSQLLHHTSGISWQTISDIPAADGPESLDSTIRKVIQKPLHHLPGKKYEYATVNYDILALVIQKVTGHPFEEWLQTNVLDALALKHTTIGQPFDSSLLATGYKIGFFSPRAYNAPVYRGNNAAGYVISDAQDMAVWLSFQMGLGEDTSLYPLALKTQQRDESVALHGMSAYAMGWEVSLNGNGEIYHDGLNPNYTSYITFNKNRSTGVALLANSNSAYTKIIGDRVMRLAEGEPLPERVSPGEDMDKSFSVFCLIIGLFVLSAAAFLVWQIIGVVRGDRVYQSLTAARIRKPLLSLLLLLPFIIGVYLLPKGLAGFTWEMIRVWLPDSFGLLMGLLLATTLLILAAYFFGVIFPEQNKFRRTIPGVLLISILSGLSNMAVILLLTSALDSEVQLKYLVFYYLLALSVYLLGNRFVQVSLIHFTRELIYNLKLQLIGKVFATSYQQFEKIDRGRVYTALEGDVEVIGGSVDQLILLVTNVFTAAGAFIYLASIAFWTAVLTIVLIFMITSVYMLVSRRTRRYFEKARDTQNVFMRLINGMIDGFKELSLHRVKKKEYEKDLADTAQEYRKKISTASVRFANVFLIGESSLTLLLGFVVFAVPKLFLDIQADTIMRFVIVLLYLIGPVNSILRAIPSVVQIKVAWRRLQGFLRDMPSAKSGEGPLPVMEDPVWSFRAEGISFAYGKKDQKGGFAIGPIDLSIKKGEIVFLIGGNGSGKTTFAKLLTGLYTPDEGHLLINNIPMEGGRLSEYFSVVFSPSHLFEKIYSVDTTQKRAEVERYLKLMDLDAKVSIADGKYNTIALSGGQRKRLALLQCYLEDSPIYLFDEWAADQDPEYRNFFYRVLLPEMKRMGKIVIAITHDDHYFDVADRVLKMQDGRLEAFDGADPIFGSILHSTNNTL